MVDEFHIYTASHFLLSKEAIPGVSSSLFKSGKKTQELHLMDDHYEVYDFEQFKLASQT